MLELKEADDLIESERLKKIEAEKPPEKKEEKTMRIRRKVERRVPGADKDKGVIRAEITEISETTESTETTCSDESSSASSSECASETPHIGEKK